MNRKLVQIHAVIAGTVALFVMATAPASAAPQLPFNSNFSGSMQVTAVGPNGPTAAFYSGPNTTATVRMQGIITITGPSSCAGGFTAKHSDTLTKLATGDTLSVTVVESTCPRVANPNIYDCTGTYQVTAGTGQLASLEGAGGAWAGVVTFSTTAPGTGSFHSTYGN